eukprot:14604-Chlamydomonas_euryale.AAC.2
MALGSKLKALATPDLRHDLNSRAAWQTILQCISARKKESKRQEATLTDNHSNLPYLHAPAGPQPSLRGRGPDHFEFRAGSVGGVLAARRHAELHAWATGRDPHLASTPAVCGASTSHVHTCFLHGTGVPRRVTPLWPLHSCTPLFTTVHFVHPPASTHAHTADKLVHPPASTHAHSADKL